MHLHAIPTAAWSLPPHPSSTSLFHIPSQILGNWILPSLPHMTLGSLPSQILGNWILPSLPTNHVRFSSTDQFCSPKRRRRSLFTGSQSTGSLPAGSQSTGSLSTGSLPTGSHPTGSHPTGSLPTAVPHGRESNFSYFGIPPASDLGIDYMPGDADLNKTTMASADPHAAVAFAAHYLGGSPVQQHRGPMAGGI